MGKTWSIYLTGSLLILLFLITPGTHMWGGQSTQITYKNIALYPSIVPAILALENSMTYQWEINGVKYQFNVTTITRREALGQGRHPLTRDNFDVFVIGASARQYFHGIDENWKRNVKTFIAEGGGYVGICGGANAATLGAANPSGFIDKVINSGSLSVANLYINDDQDEEWQFLYRSSGVESGVPLACLLTNHPIVAVSPDNPRVIRYEGGPGMYPGNHQDPLFGEIIPLATYAEEVVEKAPIHFWIQRDGDWEIEKPVATDIEGQYAGIATTYGTGRLVLFGPHPEEYTIVGGYVEEFLGRSKYTLFRDGYLYRWTDGKESSWTYNWWMVRRSVAWAADVPNEHLPPLEDNSV